MKSISILGQQRSGTTAAFYLLRDSLKTENTWYSFEPSKYEPPSDLSFERCLSKVILSVDSTIDYAPFLASDRAIYIVRDPRDWMISSMLFFLQHESAIWSDPDKVECVICLLRQKEKTPASLSVFWLLSQFVEAAEKNMSEVMSWIEKQQQWIKNFESHFSGFTIKYENLVECRLESLECYLNLRLYKNQVVVDDVHNHVARTYSFGCWKSWFVESDIEIFKPIFDDYMTRHQYNRKWILSPQQHIKPEECSKYVKRVVSKRIELMSLE